MNTTENKIVPQIKSLCLILMLLSTNIQTIISQSQSSILAIGLDKFMGENKGVQINLSWTWPTAHEATSFIVERAGENKVFEVIGVSKSNEDFFYDMSPEENIHYYRLLFIDADKKELYSKVITVDYDLDTDIIITPNPASNRIYINFNTTGKAAHILIRNPQGQLIYQESVKAPTVGRQYLYVDLTNYNTGVYVLRVLEGTSEKIKRFVVL